MKALGGSDASTVAHALAQKGDMMVWQYNVHRGPNGDMQQAPTAKIGLLANASLRVEPYTTPYAIVPHPVSHARRSSAAVDQIAAGVCLLNFAGLLIRLVRLRGATRNAGNWDKVEGVIIASEVDQPAVASIRR